MLFFFFLIFPKGFPGCCRYWCQYGECSIKMVWFWRGRQDESSCGWWNKVHTWLCWKWLVIFFFLFSSWICLHLCLQENTLQSHSLIWKRWQKNSLGCYVATRLKEKERTSGFLIKNIPTNLQIHSYNSPIFHKLIIIKVQQKELC